jgi:hypothetical protein
MELGKDILNFLRTNYHPAPGDFKRYDQQALVDKMRLREIGKDRGAKNQPAVDQPDLDVVEQSVVEALRTHAIDEEDRTRQQLTHYSERLKGSDPTGQSSSMFIQAQKAVAGFDTAMVAARAILDKERQSLLARDKALIAFQQRNNITWPAQPAKSPWVASFLLAC